MAPAGLRCQGGFRSARACGWSVLRWASVRHAPFQDMDPPDPPDHNSLMLALSRARDWLRSLQKRHLESLEPARRSLEDALGAVLQEEERLWAEAREERARLQAVLTTLQDGNERAVQAGVAKIQALWHQLGSLHTRLVAVPETGPPADVAQEAATLLAHSACLALKLTRAYFVPHPRSATLGEFQLEEQVLSFPPPQSPARAGAGHQDWICSQENGARLSGKVAQPDPGEAYVVQRVSISEPPQGEGPALETGLAHSGGEALPVAEGAREEEKGTQRALPARRSHTMPSLVGRSPGQRQPTPEAREGTAAGEPGRASAAAALPAAAQGVLPEDPDSLFHARAVLLQGDGGSESSREKGGAGTGTWPSAKGVLPRWASAESLGRWWGAPRGVGTRLGGSCMELGPPAAERASSGLESVARSKSSSARGAPLGEAAPARPPGQQNSSLGYRETPGYRRRPAARLGGTLPPSLAAPPPPCNQLVGQCGEQGSQPGQLCLPHGLHATPEGALYVADFGNRRLQELGRTRRPLPLQGKAYFDVTVGEGGRLAVTDPRGRCVELFSARGLLLQAVSEGFGSPRGIAASPRGEFLVADMRLGVVHVLLAGSGPGGLLARCKTVRGFLKPYLVATNSHGEVAVSERGLDGGCCVKVLGASWQLLRVLGGPRCPPILTNPWGVSLDEAGRVLVADWGRHAHAVLCYPPQGRGRAVVTKGLSSPRGIALLGERRLVVADSMHHCLKTFQYC